MQEPSMRNRRVADLIHREVAQLMKADISDPRLGWVMITSVDVSPDLSNARIYYTLSDQTKKKASEVSKALEKAAGFIRHKLSDRIELRRIPQINFRYDQSISRTQQLLSLIDNIDAGSND